MADALGASQVMLGALGESVTLVMATDGSVPGGLVWPDPSTVALGVSYGPTGSDYVGTKPPGGAYLRRR